MTIVETTEQLKGPLANARFQLEDHYMKLLNYYDIQKENADAKFKEFSDNFRHVFNDMTQITQNGQLGTIIVEKLHELLDVIAFVINDPVADQPRTEQGRLFVALHATIDTMAATSDAASNLIDYARRSFRNLLGINVRVVPAERMRSRRRVNVSSSRRRNDSSSRRRNISSLRRRNGSSSTRRKKSPLI